VTRQEVDGATLPVLGAHGGHGNWRGGVGCCWRVSAGWGHGRVLVGQRSATGGRGQRLVETREREGFASGSSSPSMPTE
jgi:hypothetical protein